MSEFDKFLQETSLTFEEYKEWFLSLKKGDRVFQNKVKNSYLIGEVFPSKVKIFGDAGAYNLENADIFYISPLNKLQASNFPIPSDSEIQEIIKQRTKKEEAMPFKLKVGQRYETGAGPIYEVESPQIINGQMTGLWLCRSLKTGGVLSYSPQGKLSPNSSNTTGLNFTKLIYDPSKTEESSEEDQIFEAVKKNKEKLGALRKENAELKGEVESLKARENYSNSALLKYEKACIENYELRKNIEELKALLSNSKSSELKAQADLNKTLDDFEKLENRIFVLQEEERGLQDSLRNKNEIIAQLQRNARAFEAESLLWTNEK